MRFKEDMSEMAEEMRELPLNFSSQGPATLLTKERRAEKLKELQGKKFIR